MDRTGRDHRPLVAESSYRAVGVRGSEGELVDWTLVLAMDLAGEGEEGETVAVRETASNGREECGEMEKCAPWE